MLSANVRTEVEVVADDTLSIYNLQTLAKIKEEEYRNMCSIEVQTGAEVRRQKSKHMFNR